MSVVVNCRKYLLIALLLSLSNSKTAHCNVEKEIKIVQTSERDLKALEKIVWQNIETPNYNIVFRSNFLREAQRMANTLEYLHKNIGKSLEANPKKIDVLYDNENLDINGSTSRSRVLMWTFPPADQNFLGGDDWLLFLASHELRHQAQNYIESQGLLKLVNIIGGPIFWSNYVSILSRTPKWFYEGDAVDTETVFSNYGRGRMPYYLMNQKSLILENGGCTYFKAWNRSYKDQVPGCYQLGYVMTTHMRRTYGVNVIKDIYSKMSTLGYPIFNFAVKRVTGKKLTKIYLDACKELETLWRKQLEGLHITPSETINVRKTERFYDYMYPQDLGNDLIVALKVEKDKSQYFISINTINKEEKTIMTPYHLHETIKFSVTDGVIMWIESRFPLFSNESSPPIESTAIVYFDTKANKNTRKIVTKGRYLSAALSHNKKYIAAVMSDESYNHYISILDAVSGREIRKLPNPNNKLYQSPSWTKDDKYLISSLGHNGAASIEKIDIETGQTFIILAPSIEHLGNVIEHNKYIFYQSSYNGIDNIYAIDLENNNRYQVSSKKYGAFSPSISKDQTKLYFSNYTKDGLDIESMDINPSLWIPIDKVENRDINYIKPLEDQEGNKKITTDIIPQVQYPVKRYYPILHLFNINGWMPDIFSGAFSAIKGNGYFANVSFKLEDLNGWLSQLYILQHEFQQKKGKLSIDYTFKKIIPQITLKGEIITDYEKIIKKSIESTISLPIHFPIESFDNVFTISLTPQIGQQQKTNENNVPVGDEINKTIQYDLDYLITGAETRAENIDTPKKLHIRGIYRNNFTTSANDNNNENEERGKNNNIALKANSHSTCLGLLIEGTYPGLFYRNLFALTNTFQYKSERKDESGKTIGRTGNLYIVNNLKTPIYNGYTGYLSSSRLSYKFPIIYPDLALDHLLYFKRISATLYSEFVYIPQSLFYKEVWTFGGKIYWEFMWWEHNANNQDSTFGPLNLSFSYGYTPQAFVEKIGTNEKNYRHNFSIALSIGSNSLTSFDIPDKERRDRNCPGYQK